MIIFKIFLIIYHFGIVSKEMWNNHCTCQQLGHLKQLQTPFRPYKRFQVAPFSILLHTLVETKCYNNILILSPHELKRNFYSTSVKIVEWKTEVS